MNFRTNGEGEYVNSLLDTTLWNFIDLFLYGQYWLESRMLQKMLESG